MKKKSPISCLSKQGWMIHLTLLSLSGTSLFSAGITPEQREFFENKIRPILAQECYECHSSKGKAKGKLILDHRTALLKGGGSGATIIPGDADGSLLIQAIRHESDDLEMPKDGARLDSPVIADFVKWINMGAPDPRDAPPSREELARDTDWSAILKTRKNWWSFQPIKRPELPPATEGSTEPIDRFVTARLREKNLQVGEPAPPAVLARRLYFALIGLPPTPEEMAAFQQSASRDPKSAIQDLIDQLLASPRFGEKWARHWMDWIRYAETHGSEGDPPVGNAYLYRDYLIRALNADVPYDQLVREQIAGDLLKTPRLNRDLRINESMIGPAHWRMVFHGFAPTDALDEKVRFTDDEINVFSKAFQGLTISCARCHNHKFDAISQADYYALFGILGSTRPGRKLINLREDLEKNKTALAALKPRIRTALAEDWQEAIGTLPPQFWEEKVKALFPVTESEKSLVEAWKKQRFIWMGDRQRRQSWKKISASRRWDLTSPKEYQNWFRYGNGLPDQPAASGSFTVATDGSHAVSHLLPAGVYPHLLSDKHAARLTSPDFHLDGSYELYLLVNGGGSASLRYVVQNYPRNGTVYPVTVFDDGKVPSTWRWQRYDLSYWDGDDVHIELANAEDAPLLVKNVDRSWFGIREAMLVKKGTKAPGGNTLETLDPLFETAGDKEPESVGEIAALYAGTLRDSIRKWAAKDVSDSISLQLDEAVQKGLLPNDLTELKRAAPLIRKYDQLESQVISPTRVAGLDEWTGHDQALFIRGDHKKPGDPVPRRFLDAIDPTPFHTRQSGRLLLQAHLLKDDDPFTRRVIVNRIWLHLFGSGIVSTPDNFGRLGAKPTHPALLDFLAVHLSDDLGWSLKKLIREIVSSRTWQQSSQPNSLARKLDPGNHLLSHFPVRRLEAEAIRDSLLAVSGELDSKLFGPPVSGESPRRSVYVHVIRNRLDPFLSVFDAPVPFSATGRRALTNVPAQALTMLNDPFVVGAAKKFALSCRDETDSRGRIGEMWQHALARQPTEGEMQAALNFLDQAGKRGKVIARQRATIEGQLKDLIRNRQATLSLVRHRLTRPLPGKNTHGPDLKPVAQWKFEGNGKDDIASADLTLKGTARIENEALLVDGKGYAVSPPLEFDLKEKSLEVIVMLDTLDQRAGGVMTVQDSGGTVFDAIVYAERKPRRWLAGSDRFSRTKDFNGTDEAVAADEKVHLVITYEADGTIRAFRNGEPYGNAYLSQGIATFQRGKSRILFGMRHGTGLNPSRMLRGRIFEARLYDRALNPDEVKAAATGAKNFVSNSELLSSLSGKEQVQLKQWNEKINALKGQLDRIGPPVDQSQVWENLAQSIFNLKEFIYVY